MTYTIETESNAYFRGRDAVLLNDGRRVATLALQDSGPGVKVKHGYRLGTDATKRERDELPEFRLDGVLHGLTAEFWEHLAPETARSHGFENVYQEGRSGGWCVPYPHGDWFESIDIDYAPEMRKLDEIESLALEHRERFFVFAEEITKEVEYLRTTIFDERVREAFAEHEAEIAREREQQARRARIEALPDFMAHNILVGAIDKGEIPRDTQNELIYRHTKGGEQS